MRATTAMNAGNNSKNSIGYLTPHSMATTMPPVRATESLQELPDFAMGPISVGESTCVDARNLFTTTQVAPVDPPYG
jgi:hypothetical protein